MSKMLSQAEIDALLKSQSGSGGRTGSLPPTNALSPEEIDALGEIGNVSLGSAATALSALINQRVEITTPLVGITTERAVRQEYPIPCVVVEVQYTQGLTGKNVLIIREDDARVIVDLMMGGDGTNPPSHMGELQVSAIGEAMNQMMGSSATAMSLLFKERVNISPPTVRMLDLGTDTLEAMGPSEDQEIVRIDFRMQVGDLLDSFAIQLLPLDFAHQSVNVLLGGITDHKPAATPEPRPARGEPATPSGKRRTEPTPAARQKVTVQPVRFEPLAVGEQDREDQNIDLILDVPLQITVELGRTRKMIREILELGPGSVVELDRLAGEPVDILVNGKLIAKGEVVVIDENFGVRIIDIASPMDRINNLR